MEAYKISREPRDYQDLIQHIKALAGNIDLEKRAMSYSRNPLLTESTRQLITDLWEAYNDARWVMELLWEKTEQPHGDTRRSR